MQTAAAWSMLSNTGPACKCCLLQWPLLSYNQACTVTSVLQILVLQMYYLNPVSWTLFGLVASNVGDLDDAFITLNGQTEPTSVPDFLRDQFGYRHDWLGWVVLILIGWIITLWGIGAFAFKRFNFQKR